MEGFSEHVEPVLPVLGFSFLESRPVVESVSSDASNRSPILEYYCGEASAEVQEIDGEFIDFRDSTALTTLKKGDYYRQLRSQLIDTKKLVLNAKRDLLVFAEDVAFSSPSAVAATVDAGSMNGRTAWRVQGTRQTYADWHQAQLPASWMTDLLSGSFVSFPA